MRNFILFFIMLFLCHVQVKAQGRELPSREIEKTNDGFIITYYFDKGFSQYNSIFPGTKLWKVPGFGLTECKGKPAIPFHIDTYTIPNGVKTSVKLLDYTYVDSTFILSPALPPVPDDDSPVDIKAIIPYEGFYPDNVVSKEDEYIYRGANLLDVSIQPAQYNYRNNILRIFSMIKYKVMYEKMPPAVRTNKLLTEKSGMDKILNNIVTWRESIDATRRKASSSNYSNLQPLDSYLIITTFAFANALKPFIEWKRTQGYDVAIKYPTYGAWTTENVKDSIVDFRQTHPGTFKYLLIVGDESHVPAYTCSFSTYTGLTDLYYGVFNDGFVPEIHRGRIPVHNVNEAEVVIQKIMQYEKTPITDNDFYQTGLNCAFFQDTNDSNGEVMDGYENRCFVLTAENVLKHLEQNGKTVHRVYCTGNTIIPTHWNKNYFAYGDTLPHYLLRPSFAWNGDSTDIINHINSGAFYVLHRDHGSPTLWDSPRFSRENIATLNNGNKLPIVFSLNCQTGMYNYSMGDCFAEAFLKKESGGCAGIFAATQTSYSGKNDAMALGMFDAIWPGLNPAFRTKTYNTSVNAQAPVYTLGEILDQGLMKMKQKYGNSNNVKYTFGIFHCFGDPSMEIYTNQPSNAHAPSITREGEKILVQTADTTTFIVFYDKKETPVIEKYQGSYADYSFQDDTDSVIVCVYGHNLRPVINTIYRTDKYIQNEIITGTKTYRVEHNIYVGNHVTDNKPHGDVNIINADVKMQAKEVELHPGTTITNSNLEIYTSY